MGTDLKHATLEMPLSRTVDRRDDPVANRLTMQPFLFLIIEGTRPVAGGARYGLAEVDEIVIGRGTERTAERVLVGNRWRLVITIPDRLVSSKHARLYKTNIDTWWFEDLGSRNGSRIEGMVTERAELGDRTLFEVGVTFFSFYKGIPAPRGTTPDLETDGAKGSPGTETLLPNFAASLSGVVHVARASVLPVIVLGESGTGKELLARAIHTSSGRNGAFVAVNCGALAPNLVEGQLFGHTRGAFSGAVKDEPGLVRASSKGTLFLDEIAELPPAAQTTLLRVLQESEVLPVGATKPVSVDLRVVAATHQPIDRLPHNVFRSDLYARLAGFTVRLPPLRARREDLGVMVAAMLRKQAADRAERVTFTPRALRAILDHRWPLNARELSQALGVALVLATLDEIDVIHLPEAVRDAAGADSEVPTERLIANMERRVAATAPVELTTPAQPQQRVADRTAGADDLLRESLLACLQKHSGNVSEVARVMGKTRMQIHRWMKRFGIDPETFRTSP